MPRRTLVFLVCMLLAASGVSAQYFGRNKVTWEDYDFEVVRTEHFDLHHYEETADTIDDFGRMAERWYGRLSKLLDHQLEERKPIILYADDTDFQQTHVISGDIGQGVGGVTESFKNRVAMPMTASYAETDHVLGHELVHVFQYDIIQRTEGGMRASGGLPLWFVEGMAEYLSVGPANAHSSLWLRDAVLRDELPEDLDTLSGDPRYFPYRFGHALWAYIGARWGDEAIPALFRASLAQGLKDGIRDVLGIEPDVLVEEWNTALRAEYGDLTERRTLEPSDAREIVARLPDEREVNVGPVPSPDGRHVAFYSERDLFSIELFLADTRTGEIVRKLTEVRRSPHAQALRFIDSAGTWSPDGSRFAYVVYHHGTNELAVLDVETGEELRRYAVEGVDALMGPSWSPDGRRIVISGLNAGASDLFLIDVESGEVRRLSDDRHAALQPTWSPDGQRIAYTTDRGGATNLDALVFGEMGLGVLDPDAPADVRILRPFGDVAHTDPQFSPDGRHLLFRSDVHGFHDLYRLDPRDGRVERMTDLATGVHGITPLSPAMALARDECRVYFNLFEGGGYSIWSRPCELPASSEGEPRDVALLPTWTTKESSRVARVLADSTIGLPDTSGFPREDYEPSLSLDWIGQSGAGVAVDRFGTRLSGGVSARFSDMLGNHRLGLAAQVSGSIRDAGAQAIYSDVGSRWNWGVGLAHLPYLSFDHDARIETVDGPDGQPQEVLVFEREKLRTYAERAEGFVSYPFSRTRRVEFGASINYYHFDRERQEAVVDEQGFLIDRRTFDARDPSSLFLVQPSVALVEDTAFFGFTSPVEGRRLRLEYTPTFGSIGFQSVLADGRQYLRLPDPASLAFRAMHYGRYGEGADDRRFTSLYLGYPTLVRGYDVDIFDTDDCAGGDCPEFDRLVGSRIGVVNLEFRLQVLGSPRYGLVDGGPLPTELTLFFDGGVAWSASESPRLVWEQGTDRRVPVFSAGVALRTALFGAIPLELHWAHPFQRDDRDVAFGFAIAPGW